MFSQLTALLTDYRWEDVQTPDRHRTVQLHADPTLWTMSEKGLSRALGFASVTSLTNYLTRARTRGHVAGEIGSLTCVCRWLTDGLSRSVSPPEPTAPYQGTGESQRQPRPRYPADDRYDERRREERQRGKYGQAAYYANTTPATTQAATPRARDSRERERGEEKRESLPPSGESLSLPAESAESTPEEREEGGAWQELVGEYGSQAVRTVKRLIVAKKRQGEKLQSEISYARRVLENDRTSGTARSPDTRTFADIETEVGQQCEEMGLYERYGIERDSPPERGGVP